MFFRFLLIFLTLHFIKCSEFGVSLGDGAISQLIRHSASQFLEKTRVADILLKTSESPSFGPLAQLKLFNTVSYRNISVQFHPKIVHVFFEKLHVVSHANISDVLWPIMFSDSLIDSHVKVSRGHLRFIVQDDEQVVLNKCALYNPDVALHLRDSWLVNEGMSLFGSLLSSFFEGAICSILESSTGDLSKNNERRFPIYDILPKKIQDHLAARNATLFYRVNSIQANEHQLAIKSQIEWQQMGPQKQDEATKLLQEDQKSENSTKLIDMETKNGELVTIWLEDDILNEMLDQIDWNFEWMNEQIPMSSPVIPPEARDLFSTLCTDCYFQINVKAIGRPTVSATNESLVLTKIDQIDLRAVNPNRNQTSVFVSLELTIKASLRPSVDNGTLRTGIELLDTEVVTRQGAFPKTWGFFVSDLTRGMIMDMMWPELKSAIEDLTYGKGLRISRFCGIDPNNAMIEIGEGNLAVSARLMLPLFRSETCLKELTSSIPSTSKLLQKASFKK